MLDDETLGCCPVGPRLLAYGLIHIADDSGRFRASPTFLKARVFAYNDDLPAAEVGEWLNHLAHAGFIALYHDAEQSYGWMPNWRKHQKIDRPSPSLLPAPEACEAIAAVGIRRALDEPSTKPPRKPDRGPTHSDALPTPHEQRDSGQFDEHSTNAREDSSSPREASSPEGKGQKGIGQEGKGTTTNGEHPDFADWLAHHKGVTQQTTPREGTQYRAKVAAMYRARRSEDYGAEDLCLATLGAYNDAYRREHGHYGCISVLRPEKVHDLVEKGRRGPVAATRPQSEHPASRRIRELEELKGRLAAEEAAA